MLYIPPRLVTVFVSMVTMVESVKIDVLRGIMVRTVRESVTVPLTDHVTTPVVPASITVLQAGRGSCANKVNHPLNMFVVIVPLEVFIYIIFLKYS